MTDDLLTIINGDALAMLKTLPDESVQCCVTDPPYGIGFMGQTWDNFKSSEARKKVHNNQNIRSDNPNLKGRKRAPASSPSAVKYDRTLNGQRDFQSWTLKWCVEVYRVLKPGGHLLVFGAPRSFHRMICGVEDAGFEIRDCLGWLFGQGFPKSHNLEGKWEGWGTALKPAWEPIVMARKPLIGTVAENVQRFGTGAINVDSCRVAFASEKDRAIAHENALGPVERFKTTKKIYNGGKNSAGFNDTHSPKGRWPANIVHDGSDEVLAAFPTAPGQIRDVTGEEQSHVTKNCYGEFNRGGSGAIARKDSGSAARFFYCAKASRADREDGMWGEKRDLNWSSGTQSPGTFQSENTERKVGNFHPTVKPTALMRWLITMVCPAHGTVLDPFAGSGTTGRAALELGRKAILIELNPEYCELAKQRCAVTPGLPL